jgi:hypothetical protein
MEITVNKNKLDGEVIRQELVFKLDGYVAKVQFMGIEDETTIPDKLRAVATNIEGFLSEN